MWREAYVQPVTPEAARSYIGNAFDSHSPNSSSIKGRILVSEGQLLQSAVHLEQDAAGGHLERAALPTPTAESSHYDLNFEY